MKYVLSVDDEWFNRLKSVLGANSVELVRDSFTLLNWVVQERLKGRVIVSVSPEGKDSVRVKMDRLDALHPQSIAALGSKRGG